MANSWIIGEGNTTFVQAQVSITLHLEIIFSARRNKNLLVTQNLLLSQHGSRSSTALRPRHGSDLILLAADGNLKLPLLLDEWVHQHLLLLDWLVLHLGTRINLQVLNWLRLVDVHVSIIELDSHNREYLRVPVRWLLDLPVVDQRWADDLHGDLHRWDISATDHSFHVGLNLQAVLTVHNLPVSRGLQRPFLLFDELDLVSDRIRRIPFLACSYTRELYPLHVEWSLISFSQVCTELDSLNQNSLDIPDVQLAVRVIDFG